MKINRHYPICLRNWINFSYHFFYFFYDLFLGVILLGFIISLSGCATAGKNTLPSGGDMTMAQIYQQETGLSDDSADYNAGELTQARREIQANGLNDPSADFSDPYTAYTVYPSNATEQLFKSLPNPEIPIYIFPHLVYADGETQPVPGYTTAFYLYRENHFAMPSEVY